MAQVTEALGVAAPVLRRWERAGLVRPERTAGGQRRYSRREIERLRHVAQLAGEGMTISGIRRVLDLEQRIDELEDELASRDAERPADDRLGGEENGAGNAGAWCRGADVTRARPWWGAARRWPAPRACRPACGRAAPRWR
jgi:MerR family transcriptional regulator, heat shock protein HspR